MRYANPMFRHPGAGRGPASSGQSFVPAFAGITALMVFQMTVPAGAFDCAKATTMVEKAICADAALKRIDDELAAVYGAVRASLTEPEQKMMTLSQKRWIARREACGSDVNCVKGQTEERLTLLKGQAESGPGPERAVVPGFIVQIGTAASPDLDIALLRFATPATPGEMKLNALADKIAAVAQASEAVAREDRFAITYASPTFMSVRHWFHVNEGGAHGLQSTRNYNIDMASGRLISVTDVLAEPPAAILTLWCKAQIEAEKRKRVPDADLSESAAERDDAIAARVMDLASWSIGEREIVVSFDPSVVGAYAEGAYECRFPTGGVKEMALAGAPLP
jgi:uncharacterized protein